MTRHRLTSRNASAWFQVGRSGGALPAYRQLDNHSCGFVAALAVIHYFDPDVPVRDVFEYVRPCAYWGCDDRIMVKTLRKFGVDAVRRDRMGQHRLRCQVGVGPVIVSVWPHDWWVDHWTVVRDVADDGRVRLVNHGPPRAGMAWEEFDTQWWPHGRGWVCSKR